MTHIGSWSALLKLSAKCCVKSEYSCSGPQVKQTSAISLVAVAALLVSLPSAISSLLTNEAHASVLSGSRPAKQNEFFNWDYAKKAWIEWNTWKTLQANSADADKVFIPWLRQYEKNPQAAMKALNSYPKTKRERIKRGHDVQVAYDTWWKHVYMDWYKGYFASFKPRKKKPMSFDEILQLNSDNAVRCGGNLNILHCGPYPDWRSEKNKADEKKMMAQSTACFSCIMKESKTRNYKQKTQCRPICKGLGRGW